ncbi:MAG: alginate lyase family protein [Candidatus Pacebacteria bacterium]|nr:alginate lyase family protein [Candidatus Paceibacterota bacterium]
MIAISLSNLFFTLINLKLIQVYHQIHYRLKKKFFRRRGYYLSIPNLDFTKVAQFQFPIFYTNNIDDNLVLTQHSIRIDLKNPNKWNGYSYPLLELYHLHYFDFLHDHSILQNPDFGYELIFEWIDNNQSMDSIAWDSYPTSLRIVNWIKFINTGHQQPLQTIDKILESLVNQTIHLSKNLEYNILGNHLLANLKALFISAHFFRQYPNFGFDKIVFKATKLLIEQFDEQILKDGAHFERSFMYQSIVLLDLFDIYTVVISLSNDQKFISFLNTKIELSLDYYLHFLHPDGRIGFFNDANHSNSVSTEVITQYSRLHLFDIPTIKTQSFLSQASGFAILQNRSAKLIADIGSIAPDYLPAHAHAETLSFELSLYQHRLIVNSGVGEYGQSAERISQRGTAAHSTLRLNGKNSSAVWGGFRMGRRARATARLDAALNQLTASHDGWRRRRLLVFRGGWRHQRRWQLTESRLVVSDCLLRIGQESSHPQRVEIFYHLHPDWQVVQTAVNEFTITRDGLIVKFSGSLSLDWRAEPSSYHPQFGLSIANLCLVGEGLLSLNQEISVELHWT